MQSVSVVAESGADPVSENWKAQADADGQFTVSWPAIDMTGDDTNMTVGVAVTYYVQETADLFPVASETEGVAGSTRRRAASWRY